MSTVNIKQIDNDIYLVVKVVPGSSRTAVAGELGGMLKVKVASAPEKGKANSCLIDFLADKLSVKKKDIVIVSGKTNMVKQLRISNCSAEKISRALGLVLDS